MHPKSILDFRSTQMNFTIVLVFGNFKKATLILMGKAEVILLLGLFVASCNLFAKTMLG